MHARADARCALQHMLLRFCNTRATARTWRGCRIGDLLTHSVYDIALHIKHVRSPMAAAVGEYPEYPAAQWKWSLGNLRYTWHSRSLVSLWAL